MGERQVSVFLPPQAREERVAAMVLNVGAEEDAAALAAPLWREMGRALRPAALICVCPVDWNRDFSPWPAPPLHPGGEPFSGGWPVQLRRLEEEILPAARARLPLMDGPENTGILGYSLGGLAALHALYASENFGMVGCLSGSLWYEGFMDFQRERAPACMQARVYLSLGRREERTRHPLLCRIGDCTRQTQALLQQRLGEERVQYDVNDGGHATEVERRMLRGLGWLLAADAR